MKLALICTEKLPVPPVAGGAVQLYIDGVLPYLAKKHDVTVFCIQYDGLKDFETVDNVKYIRVAGKNEIQYLESIKKALADEYDLIHVFNRPKIMLGLSDERPHQKFSLSLHNEMFRREKMSDEEGRRCIERAEFINTVSRYISDTVANRFPGAESKLRVVYSGVNPDLYKTRWSPEGIENMRVTREKLGLQGKKVILFVGRLSAKKGVHILLRATKKLMEEDPGIALLIVGSKWYGKNDMDDYTKSIHRNAETLPGPVVFTGFIPPADIPAYYNAGDVFVCASQWNEPLARVHYEAMAAGLPIITTNRGGNSEVIRNGENGLIVDDYSNPDSFAECMRKLLYNPGLALEMGKRGRLLAEERFNWKRVADEMLGDFS